MTTYAEVGLGWTEERFPRAARWGWEFARDNNMGPNVAWLAEALSEVVELRPGMRVLDLGCGKAASSIFFAKEFGSEVWATDLWIRPGDNLKRIEAAGLADLVVPVYAEAHSLPYAPGFFDAIVSLDAFHYFGTDDLYARTIAGFLKPGGALGIIVPGLVNEIESVPEQLVPYWHPEFWSFHSPGWWRRNWERSAMLDVYHAELLPEGARCWLGWAEALMAAPEAPTDGPRPPAGAGQRDLDMLRADAGRTLGFSVVAARRV